MANRLDASIEAMAKRFPTFRYSEDSAAGMRRGLWVGAVQPIQLNAIPNDLLDDLWHDEPVFVVGDRVEHWNGCHRIHCDHGLALDTGRLKTRFKIEVLHNGTAAMPRCRVLEPAIPREKANHMWHDGAMCAFLAADWDYRTQTVADAMDDHLIWLVKWMVFEQSGVWMGRQHFNSPEYHLLILKSKDLCWCGSGSQYRRCHKKSELGQVKAWGRRRF